MEYLLNDEYIVDLDPVVPVYGPAVILSISKNGTVLPIDENKNVDITVPTKITDLINDSDFVEHSELATVATSGDYNDLLNLPVIPDLTGYATESFVSTEIGTHNSSNSAHQDIRNILSGVTELIPAEATVTNQLADKNFVNSSIATNTATFRGTYNVVSDLNLHYNSTHSEIGTALGSTIATADDNDYCFVQIPTADATPTEIKVVERYKYSGSAWQYEYDLNNSGFTAAQWASINSGATSTLVGQITTNANDITTLNTAVSGKVAKVGDTMSGGLLLSTSDGSNWIGAYRGAANINRDCIYFASGGAGINFGLLDSTYTSTTTRGLAYTNSNGVVLYGTRAFYTGGTVADDNKCLNRTEADARWLQIAPPTSSSVTLTAGSLNNLGTVDFSTIALPASPGTAEYSGTFTDGSVAGGDITTNTGLSAVTLWAGDTTIVTGHTYSFSIQDGNGLIIQMN